MRIAVIGNCQAIGVGACVGRLVPGAEVEAHNIATLGPGLPGGDPEEIARRIAGYDLVLAQPQEIERLGPLRTGELRGRARRLALFPAISFDGFHPDSVYVSRDGEHLHSPVGAYHSAIVAGAFLAGIPAERVPALFNAYVYALLGYPARYDTARAFLGELGGRAGFALDEACIAGWQAAGGGAWMHTINHPTIRVLFTLARMALAKVGVAQDEAASAAEVEDRLATDTIWPVYPELAERLGVEGGGLVFLRGGGPRATRESRAVGLESYVAQAYRTYAGLPRQVLAETRPVARAAETLARALDGRSAGADVAAAAAAEEQEALAESFVLAVYRTVLGREPEPVGFQAWVGQVRKRGLAEGFEDTIRAFCASAEGRRRLRELYPEAG